MAFATVPVNDYDITQGVDQVKAVASSDFGRRRFCCGCGTPLTMQVDHQPDTIDFTLATLDRPDEVAPQFHIFYASRIGWAQACDGMDRHDRFRPETRGL